MTTNMSIPMSAYPTLLSGLQQCSEAQRTGHLRNLCRTDLYFLIRYGLNRKDIEHQWLYDRCREVQEKPNGYLDLWAREHYKSTIITYAKSIQDILASHGEDPLPEWEGIETTIGIFSHTRPISKKFLRQIQQELATNDFLKTLFPDILYANPDKEAPIWSLDSGLVVRRKTNPKEATVEAWGIVDGQPTSVHFFERIYDDVVTIASVRSSDMIQKTTESWELSLNLGMQGGLERYIGTRYHYNDSYREMIERKAVIPRIYPGTIDGKVEGEPVLKTREEMTDKRRTMGPYTFACQILQDPVADSIQGFKEVWLKHYKTHNQGQNLNSYILVDPANEKKKTSDYTAIWVVGLGGDDNYYVLDIIRDRLSLTERGDAIFYLHRKWKPKAIGYEKYGMQADIDYLEDRMERENYRFQVQSLGGSLAKNDRIRRLIPLFEQSRVYLPQELFKKDYEGNVKDLVDVFIVEEYRSFPVGIHDDMLDALARIEDMDVIWPNYSWGKPLQYDNRGIV